jgi:hypothetical protein
MFRDWQESDFEAAKSLINSCRTLFFDHGRTDDMLSLLKSQWAYHLQRLKEAEGDAAEKERLVQREHARLAVIQSNADAYSQAHRESDANTGRKVRIFYLPNEAKYHTGDTVPASSLNTILFTEEPCPLPLANSDGVFRAWMHYSTHQLGCWYPALENGFVFISSLPALTHHSNVPWEAFPRALLHEDGSATIVEPDYDSERFQSQVMQRKVLESSHEHRNEKP